MIKVDEIIIVEGKHDKIKLSSFINGTIIETNGFRIFSDKKKQGMIRKLATTRGIIILTDSDSAGFVIRSFLKSILPQNTVIKNAYIPQILGKEKRKDTHSKEGFLGVEGIDIQSLKEILQSSVTNICSDLQQITKTDFFIDGLTGAENSALRRQKIIKKLDLPSYITTNALLEYINIAVGKEKYNQIINEI